MYKSGFNTGFEKKTGISEIVQVEKMEIMNHLRNGTRRLGSLSLELVMVIPVLALVTMGIVQYSSHLFALQAVQGAAMVGARTLETTSVNVKSTVITAVKNALNYPYKNGFNDSNSVKIYKLNADGATYSEVTEETDLSSGQFMVSVSINRKYAVMRGLNKYQVGDTPTETLKDYPNPGQDGSISAMYAVVK